MPICIPPNQPNPIKSITGAFNNPSPRKHWCFFSPRNVHSARHVLLPHTRAIKDTAAGSPIPQIDHAEPRPFHLRKGRSHPHPTSLASQEAENTSLGASTKWLAATLPPPQKKTQTIYPGSGLEEKVVITPQPQGNLGDFLDNKSGNRL